MRTLRDRRFAEFDEAFTHSLDVCMTARNACLQTLDAGDARPGAGACATVFPRLVCAPHRRRGVMMFGRAAAVALVAAVGCAAPAAGAEKSGSFTLIGSFQHDYSAVEHADGTIFGGPLEGTGTIVESSGGPFAGAHTAM